MRWAWSMSTLMRRNVSSLDRSLMLYVSRHLRRMMARRSAFVRLGSSHSYSDTFLALGSSALLYCQRTASSTRPRFMESSAPFSSPSGNHRRRSFRSSASGAAGCAPRP